VSRIVPFGGFALLPEGFGGQRSCHLTPPQELFDPD
jgi:hypothetical protein